MKKNITKMWTLFILFLFLTSCAMGNFTVTTHPIENFNGQDRIDMIVALKLSHDLCDLTQEIGFGKALLVTGGIFCENAKRVTQASFTEISIVEPGQQIPISNIDAVLTPLFKNIDFARGLWAGSTSKLLITMEWSLTRASGDLIWTETIAGEGITQTGHGFNYKKVMEQQLQVTIDDLFRKTYKEIINSQEIRTFAQSQ